MSKANEPLIRLEPGGRAPILSYNLPEPAVYFGNNFIELDYDEDIFTDVAYERPDNLDPEPVEPIPPPDEEEVVDPSPDPTPPPDDPTPPADPTPPDDPTLPPDDDPRFPGGPPPDKGDPDRDPQPLATSATDRLREIVRIRDHRGRLEYRSRRLAGSRPLPLLLLLTVSSGTVMLSSASPMLRPLYTLPEFKNKTLSL